MDSGLAPSARPGMTSESMPTWREFWDSAHSIYVSERHKDVHYRDVAEQLAAFVPGPEARVLDHGSGEAIHADLVAARARTLYLCDAAASVRAAAAVARSKSRSSAAAWLMSNGATPSARCCADRRRAQLASGSTTDTHWCAMLERRGENAPVTQPYVCETT